MTNSINSNFIPIKNTILIFKNKNKILYNQIWKKRKYVIDKNYVIFNKIVFKHD